SSAPSPRSVGGGADAGRRHRTTSTSRRPAVDAFRELILSLFSRRFARLDVHSPEPVKSLLSLLVCAAALSAGSASDAAIQPRLALPPGLDAGPGTETSAHGAGYGVRHQKPFTSAAGTW